MKWQNTTVGIDIELLEDMGHTRDFLERGDKLVAAIIDNGPQVLDHEDRCFLMGFTRATQALRCMEPALRVASAQLDGTAKQIVETAVHDLARSRMYAAANALMTRTTPICAPPKSPS